MLAPYGTNVLAERLSQWKGRKSLFFAEHILDIRFEITDLTKKLNCLRNLAETDLQSHFPREAIFEVACKRLDEVRKDLEVLAHLF